MPRVTRDGVSIHYEHERDRGDPIVFLQGLGFGRWMWRWQREGLTSDGSGTCDVIAPDTRGTGRSDSGHPPLVPRLPRRLRRPLLTGRLSYSVGGLAADLEAVLEDAGVYNAHLVGLDVGGMIALRYALEYNRASSLTLIGTSHGGVDALPMDENARKQVLARPKRTDRENVRHRMRPVFSEAFTNRNPHLIDRLIEWRLEQDADDPALETQLGAFTSFDVTDRLERIRLPTLVIHGSDDQVVPVANGRLLHEKLPASQYLEIEGGSHGCFLEDSELVNGRIREFLADLTDTVTV